jgi:hypothetical protein
MMGIFLNKEIVEEKINIFLKDKMCISEKSAINTAHSHWENS